MIERRVTPPMMHPIMMALLGPVLFEAADDIVPGVDSDDGETVVLTMVLGNRRLCEYVHGDRTVELTSM